MSPCQRTQVHNVDPIRSREFCSRRPRLAIPTRASTSLSRSASCLCWCTTTLLRATPAHTPLRHGAFAAQGAPHQLEISKWPFAKVSACGRTRGTRAIVHPCARSWVQPNGRRLALCARACHHQGCSSSLCASFAADSACTQLRQAHRLCWRAADAESCPELLAERVCG